MTGTWPELPERALNIICISLKFLHTFAWNPPIVRLDCTRHGGGVLLFINSVFTHHFVFTGSPELELVVVTIHRFH